MKSHEHTSPTPGTYMPWHSLKGGHNYCVSFQGGACAPGAPPLPLPMYHGIEHYIQCTTIFSCCGTPLSCSVIPLLPCCHSSWTLSCVSLLAHSSGRLWAPIPAAFQRVAMVTSMHHGIRLPWQPYCCTAVLGKAVTASRWNWLRCTGYHGNPGVLVIAVNRIWHHKGQLWCIMVQVSHTMLLRLHEFVGLVLDLFMCTYMYMYRDFPRSCKTQWLKHVHACTVSLDFPEQQLVHVDHKTDNSWIMCQILF